MPRAWSDEEKSRARQALVDEGQRLFELYGLRKTSVEEIARAAGVSKGAFYLFFSSKEELYFEILSHVERSLREELYVDVASTDLPPRERLRRFLYRLTDMLMSVPIYRQISSADFQSLVNRLPQELLENHLQNDQEYFSRYFISWIEAGVMRPVDVKALNGVLVSLVYFVIHRQDLGSIDFDRSKELYIDMLSEYLVPVKEEEKP